MNSHDRLKQAIQEAKVLCGRSPELPPAMSMARTINALRDAMEKLLDTTEEVWEIGFDDGYESAYSEGYDDGFEDGKAEATVKIN